VWDPTGASGRPRPACLYGNSAFLQPWKERVDLVDGVAPAGRASAIAPEAAKQQVPAPNAWQGAADGPRSAIAGQEAGRSRGAGRNSPCAGTDFGHGGNRREVRFTCPLAAPMPPCRPHDPPNAPPAGYVMPPRAATLWRKMEGRRLGARCQGRHGRKRCPGAAICAARATALERIITHPSAEAPTAAPPGRDGPGDAALPAATASSRQVSTRTRA